MTKHTKKIISLIFMCRRICLKKQQQQQQQRVSLKIANIEWKKNTKQKRNINKIMMPVVWEFNTISVSIVSIKINIQFFFSYVSHHWVCNHFKLFVVHIQNRTNDINSWVPCKTAQSSIKFSVFWLNLYDKKKLTKPKEYVRINIEQSCANNCR